MMEDESVESRIQQAMSSRVQHFRDQADSLTFEGVRRVLEKDLLLDPYALDVHKRYVKQLLEKYLNGTADDDNVSKDSEQNKIEQVKEEDEERPKEHKITEDEGKIEDSPVMGLLAGNESAKSGKSETQAEAKGDLPSEDMITEAIRKRGTYFRSKSEEITVAGVRRLLEEDLELKKYSLDSFKKLISKQLDEVLTSTEIPEKKTSINSKSKTPRKKGSKSDTDSSNSESENIEVEEKPKKKRGPKGKLKISEGPKKRKKPTQETKQGRKKKIKLDEEMSDEKNGQDVDDESCAEKSDSSAEKSVKVQKEVVAPVYGKKVERLKSIIKSCGMTVAPSLYKKAKQVPEDKREAFIIKELQEILSKEGLSTNPSEKEIKEVKRRKERAKELEGIDTSNIVLGSRRRSTFNFVAPPKPKEPIENDGDDSEDTNNDDDDDDDDDSEDTNNEEADDQGEDDVHAAQSEEAHEDTEGSE